ncbi:hypothetical protein F5Y17DRAFT_476221 [Xylariaceae sp. FL0594]|nr:hypothetical protein F5Y17DRAFT_476221 [Xylariaceae sp. FL0594]
MAFEMSPIEIGSYERTSSTDKHLSGTGGKHRKGRPSIDASLAQTYKDRQALPPVEQGADPRLEESESMTSIETGILKIILDDGPRSVTDNKNGKGKGKPAAKDEEEKNPNCPDDKSIKPKKDDLPRDPVTGQVISEEEGRTCLRCHEKGLRCTLNYVSKEREPQCAACRRSKAQYCVSFRLWDRDGTAIGFTGPLWMHPGFVAGTLDGPAQLSPLEMQKILREYFEGEKGYIGGNHLFLNDTKNFALPPFNGLDLPAWARPEKYESMTWEDVLPIWYNRSLRPLNAAATEDELKRWEAKEDKKKALTEARYAMLQSIWNPQNADDQKQEVVEEEEEEEEVDELTQAIRDGIKRDREKAELEHSRYMRRYPPRNQHVTDVLGETW